jgi:diacylglycerol kinase (ATP)
VNPKSGERASADFLFEELNRLLPGRVVDLSTCFRDNSAAISLIATHGAGGVLIVAGGDGTVSWGMDLVDASGLAEESKPWITVIPMGTGNDLSRSLRFGPGFAKEKCPCACGCCTCCLVGSLDQTVMHAISAPKAHMDRWNIQVTAMNGTPVETRVMNNYFSIGFDAHIAKKFDVFRKKNPGWCKARVMNKLWYGCLGLRSLCGEPVLNRFLTLTIDGAPVPLPDGIKSLVVSNVDSFAGGVTLWKDSKNRFKPVAIDDGLVEVQGMYGSFHMGLMQGKMRSAVKIGQGSTVRIVVSQCLHMQWDGEAMDKVREAGDAVTVDINHHSFPKILNARALPTSA